MPSPKAEKEWLEGPSRRVIVHARKIPNERKRLLALCGFFNKYRQLFSHAAIPLAMDIVEKFADGVVGEPHYKRAAGLIQTFDWGRESIDELLLLDLMEATRGAATPSGEWIERVLPMLKLVDEEAALLRDVFGNPFRSVAIDPEWLSSTVLTLASGIYEEKAFDRMPILADALQDADCDNEEILNHCRSEGPHVRGCWVVDLLLRRSE
jgi:hypothetical protein